MANLNLDEATPALQPEADPIWPHIRITSYPPSHRQFRLDDDLTPEQITKALGGIEPKKREGGDGKVTLQWVFYAEITYVLPDGGHGSTSTGCKIWDYKGERWSAYGWPEAFQQVGLTPLLTKDCGTWKFDEDGNPTLPFLRQGLRAAAANKPDTSDGSTDTAVVRPIRTTGKPLEG